MTIRNRTFKKRFLFYLTVAGIRVFTLPFLKSIQGVERLPAEPYIIAANHRSLIDGLIVVNEFNRIRGRAMHMIAYSEPFAHFFYGRILKVSGCLPFDRSDAESRLHVLRLALGFLKEGEPVGIFPEAHLSKSDTMRQARPGMALLALESGVPVVPVGIRDSEKFLEPGTGKIRLGVRASLEIGNPISPAPWRRAFHEGDQRERQEAITEFTTHVMEAIAVISGQIYPKPRVRRRHENTPSS